MTAWLPAQRRAEAFEAALVGDAADPRFADLLEVVGALRESAEITPVTARSDYTADLRARLMAAADTELVPTDAKLLLPQRTGTTRTRRQSRLTAAAAALVVVSGTAGIAAASSSALPGDSLYPFKRGVEAAESSLAFSDAARGRDKLEQADARLAEITRMARGQGDESQLETTIQSFVQQAGDGSDLLFTDFQSNGDVSEITDVRTFASSAMAQVGDLVGQVPADVRPDLADAASLLADVDQQASVLCGGCGAREPLQAPSAFRPAVAADPLVTLLKVETPDSTKPTTGGSGSQSTDPGDDPGGVSGTTDGLGKGVGGLVDDVVGGLTGGGKGGSGGGSGSGGGTSGGGTGTVVKDPIGSLLGQLPLPKPTPTSGGLVGGVGDTVGGLLGQ